MIGKIKTFIVISAIITLFGALSSAPAESATKLTVSAAAVPHTELLEFVKPKLAEQGIDLQIITIDEAAGRPAGRF